MLFDNIAISPIGQNSQTENFGNWEFWDGLNPFVTPLYTPLHGVINRISCIYLIIFVFLGGDCGWLWPPWPPHHPLATPLISDNISFALYRHVAGGKSRRMYVYVYDTRVGGLRW